VHRAAARLPLSLAPPAGMRDLLPPEAGARRQLARTVLELFAQYGYELVTTPPFEHADVIERGQGTLDRRDLLRFVDSDTGEVVLLRPDITPQIARVVATRLADRPPPYRLSYEGHVVRRRRGRARRQRQIAQAGVEHVGTPGTLADAEIVALASRALDALGLGGHTIELRLTPVARTALDPVPEAARAEMAEAVARKDRAAVEELAVRAGLGKAAHRTLAGMIELWGGREVLAAARKVFPASRRQLQALSDLAHGLAAEGLGDRLAFDLGEVRGFGYYTGPSFVLLAEGPGEPLGGGGRYDDLLARFGAPLPATGFGLDLDNLEWALAAAGGGQTPRGPARLVVCGTPARALGVLAGALRRAGAIVATLPAGADGLAFAEGWRYDALLDIGARRVEARRLTDGARARWARDSASPAEIAGWAIGKAER